MGNGPRVKDPTSVVESYGSPVSVDLGKSTLTEDDIGNLFAASALSYGRPDKMILSMQSMMAINKHLGSRWIPRPEYDPTPWAEILKLTKREMAIAGIHTTLAKLKVLKKIDEEEFNGIVIKSRKRLKRARWAQYNRKKKVQSPL